MKKLVLIALDHTLRLLGISLIAITLLKAAFPKPSFTEGHCYAVEDVLIKVTGFTFDTTKIDVVFPGMGVASTEVPTAEIQKLSRVEVPCGGALK